MDDSAVPLLLCCVFVFVFVLFSFHRRRNNSLVYQCSVALFFRRCSLPHLSVSMRAFLILHIVFVSFQYVCCGRPATRGAWRRRVVGVGGTARGIILLLCILLHELRFVCFCSHLIATNSLPLILRYAACVLLAASFAFE